MTLDEKSSHWAWMVFLNDLPFFYKSNLFEFLYSHISFAFSFYIFKFLLRFAKRLAVDLSMALECVAFDAESGDPIWQSIFDRFRI